MTIQFALVRGESRYHVSTLTCGTLNEAYLPFSNRSPWDAVWWLVAATLKRHKPGKN